MKPALCVPVLLLAGCVQSSPGETGTAARRSSSPPRVQLTNEKVPVETFHLEGMADGARFMRKSSTGSFEVLPAPKLAAGSRIELRGQGCTDATSVYVVLYRWKVGDHDRDQTWIDTRRFRTTQFGWSGHVRLPKAPKRADYGVWAVCELDGHAYFPSAWDIRVRER